VKIGKKEVQANILHFVDDIKFIVKACMKNIIAIKNVLQYFEFVLGL